MAAAWILPTSRPYGKVLLEPFQDPHNDLQLEQMVNDLVNLVHEFERRE
jgi:hypothetical protein